MTYLPYDRALKHDEHEQREYTVIPVFVQTPEGYTEYLEYEEGCRCVVSKQLRERWDGDVELVASVEREQRWQLGGLDTFGFEEGGDGRPTAGRVRESREDDGRCLREDEGVALVAERICRGVCGDLLEEGDYLSLASVLMRNEPNAVRLFNRACLFLELNRR